MKTLQCLLASGHRSIPFPTRIVARREAKTKTENRSQASANSRQRPKPATPQSPPYSSGQGLPALQFPLPTRPTKNHLPPRANLLERSRNRRRPEPLQCPRRSGGGRPPAGSRPRVRWRGRGLGFGSWRAAPPSCCGPPSRSSSPSAAFSSFLASRAMPIPRLHLPRFRPRVRWFPYRLYF